ncbi:MAG: arsenic efflux protein [Acetatifactor sp.]|nr:arsenic efflux protein [Acetatifactor sp.]
MQEVIFDTFIDGIKLIPFLFLTYLAMEYLEHRTGDRVQRMVKKAGRLGPLIGGLLGVVPQCGFSTAASNLYAGRVVTMGTLLAIYLSTSDEMLPILISEQASVGLILRILLGKMIIGALAGFGIDLIFRRKEKEHRHIHDICEQEHCHCEQGILRSAVTHTLKITFFILVITFLLNIVLHFVGQEALAGLVLNRPVLGPVLAGIVGLIPNCAASVVITQLYLQGAMSAGAMMAGLLVGSGVGLLVLFRVNHNRRENLTITGLLYLIGVLAGIMIEFII